MKENFTKINNEIEQFTEEVCEDIESFKESISPYYKELLNKGYSHIQIQNIIFQTMMMLKVDIEFNSIYLK